MIAGLIPRATAALSTLEFSQRLFKSWNPDNKLTAGYAYISGGLSGVSEGIAFSPFQVIKVGHGVTEGALTAGRWYQGAKHGRGPTSAGRDSPVNREAQVPQQGCI